MARFAGLGLEPILADSDDDDGDMGFRRAGFGIRGDGDRRGKGGGNDAVSPTNHRAALCLCFFMPPVAFSACNPCLQFCIGYSGRVDAGMSWALDLFDCREPVVFFVGEC